MAWATVIKAGEELVIRAGQNNVKVRIKASAMWASAEKRPIGGQNGATVGTADTAGTGTAAEAVTDIT
jgi:hypothetical protein